MRSDIEKRLKALENKTNGVKDNNKLIILQHNETMADYCRSHPEYDPDKLTLIVKLSE